MTNPCGSIGTTWWCDSSHESLCDQITHAPKAKSPNHSLLVPIIVLGLDYKERKREKEKERERRREKERNKNREKIDK